MREKSGALKWLILRISRILRVTHTSVYIPGILCVDDSFLGCLTGSKGSKIRCGNCKGHEVARKNGDGPQFGQESQRRGAHRVNSKRFD